MLNLLLALFHVFLCYRIFDLFGSKPFYPLMEMLGIGGMLLIFFLAFTSLFCSAELVKTGVGRSVIVLNILIYLARVLGEVILFPRPSSLVIGPCALLALLYAYIYFWGRVETPNHLTRL